MNSHTFRGDPSEVGRAQGVLSSEAARKYLAELQAKPHRFDNPYFRRNLAFMKREFPDLIEQIAAFGAAAGMESLEHAYYSHVHWTGPQADGCSALGLLLAEDGPALLTTNDAGAGQAADIVEDAMVSVFPDARPHGFMGIGGRGQVTVHRAVNAAGLAVAGASGHRQFTSATCPEHLNLYFTVHLIAQHCADCADVRRFVEHYRLSGQKGTNLVAVDAKGNILGAELESGNIAFSEPQAGVLLEVNHYQHPALQTLSRRLRPEFWGSAYYYNSQARVIYLDHYRQVIARMRTLDELIDFSFDVHAPGRLVQLPERNVGDMISCYVGFLTPRDRTMRWHLHPVSKGEYQASRYPEGSEE